MVQLLQSVVGVATALSEHDLGLHVFGLGYEVWGSLLVAADRRMGHDRCIDQDERQYPTPLEVGAPPEEALGLTHYLQCPKGSGGPSYVQDLSSRNAPRAPPSLTASWLQQRETLSQIGHPPLFQPLAMQTGAQKTRPSRVPGRPLDPPVLLIPFVTMIPSGNHLG